MEAKLDKAFDDCVQEGEKGDPVAAEATADFFQKLLGPDSKVRLHCFSCPMYCKGPRAANMLLGCRVFFCLGERLV